MTTPTLPSNVDYGYVTGQFLLAVGDSSDADATPDGVAPEGLTITFTPEPGWLLNVSATANPITILPSEIVCTVDSEGYLVDPAGNRGVYLIATDDPDLNPINWNYTVTFRFPDRPKRSFNIAVPMGSETDLTTATPVAGSIGNAVVRGEPGPANVLTIGEVLTGSAGTNATATITGTSPEQVLNLTIPKGDPGDTGPANVLSIGTVTTGAPGTNADATISGTAPNQTLDLTIPQGGTGDAATVIVGTVTTGPAGSAAAVVNSGDTHDAVLDFTIPKGDLGDPGPANILTIGTVTTGVAGSSADAIITGVSPNQTLDLTIPQGDPGDTGTRGSMWRSGAGAPTFVAGDLDVDMYLDTATGDVYECDGANWSKIGSIKGAPGTGSGTVNSVNGLPPDGAGNVVLNWVNVSGVIPTSKIPAAALTIPTVVADEAAMLALDAQQGDVAIRSDNQVSYMLAAGGNPTTLADWLPISTPGGVTSVNGQQGVVVLSFATTAQGALADSAVQPGDLATVATTGAYSDLSGKPTIPTSATDVGAIADPATKQPGDMLTFDGTNWAAAPAPPSGGASLSTVFMMMGA